MAAAVDYWTSFQPTITALLEADDDPVLWASVINRVYADAAVFCRMVPRRWTIITQGQRELWEVLARWDSR